MSDEEVAVIETAMAVDRIFWPPNAAAGAPLSELYQAIQRLHEALLALDSKRKQVSGA